MLRRAGLVRLAGTTAAGAGPDGDVRTAAPHVSAAMSNLKQQLQNGSAPASRENIMHRARALWSSTDANVVRAGSPCEHDLRNVAVFLTSAAAFSPPASARLVQQCLTWMTSGCLVPQSVDLQSAVSMAAALLRLQWDDPTLQRSAAAALEQKLLPAVDHHLRALSSAAPMPPATAIGLLLLLQRLVDDETGLSTGEAHRAALHLLARFAKAGAAGAVALCDFGLKEWSVLLLTAGMCNARSSTAGAPALSADDVKPWVVAVTKLLRRPSVVARAADARSSPAGRVALHDAVILLNAGAREALPHHGDLLDALAPRLPALIQDARIADLVKLVAAVARVEPAAESGLGEAFAAVLPQLHAALSRQRFHIGCSDASRLLSSLAKLRDVAHDRRLSTLLAARFAECTEAPSMESTLPLLAALTRLQQGGAGGASAASEAATVAVVAAVVRAMEGDGPTSELQQQMPTPREAAQLLVCVAALCPTKYLSLLGALRARGVLHDTEGRVALPAPQIGLTRLLALRASTLTAVTATMREEELLTELRAACTAGLSLVACAAQADVAELLAALRLTLKATREEIGGGTGESQQHQQQQHQQQHQQPAPHGDAATSSVTEVLALLLDAIAPHIRALHSMHDVATVCRACATIRRGGQSAGTPRRWNELLPTLALRVGQPMAGAAPFPLLGICAFVQPLLTAASTNAEERKGIAEQLAAAVQRTADAMNPTELGVALRTLYSLVRTPVEDSADGATATLLQYAVLTRLCAAVRRTAPSMTTAELALTASLLTKLWRARAMAADVEGDNAEGVSDGAELDMERGGVGGDSENERQLVAEYARAREALARRFTDFLEPRGDAAPSGLRDAELVRFLGAVPSAPLLLRCLPELRDRAARLSDLELTLLVTACARAGVWNRRMLGPVVVELQARAASADLAAVSAALHALLPLSDVPEVLRGPTYDLHGGEEGGAGMAPAAAARGTAVVVPALLRRAAELLKREDVDDHATQQWWTVARALATLPFAPQPLMSDAVARVLERREHLSPHQGALLLGAVAQHCDEPPARPAHEWEHVATQLTKVVGVGEKAVALPPHHLVGAVKAVARLHRVAPHAAHRALGVLLPPCITAASQSLTPAQLALLLEAAATLPAVWAPSTGGVQSAAGAILAAARTNTRVYAAERGEGYCRLQLQMGSRAQALGFLQSLLMCAFASSRPGDDSFAPAISAARDVVTTSLARASSEAARRQLLAGDASAVLLATQRFLTEAELDPALVEVVLCSATRLSFAPCALLIRALLRDRAAAAAEPCATPPAQLLQTLDVRCSILLRRAPPQQVEQLLRTPLTPQQLEPFPTLRNVLFR